MSYSREKSQPIFDRALNVLVKGVSSNFRFLGENETPVIVKGKGAHVWDADDNEFIDYRLGWGPIILGHADDRVNQAVTEHLENGTTFSATSELEVIVAEKLVKMIPGMEKLRFTNTGTEATTRVSIESTDAKGKNWFTIGVSPNIIDASFKALIDSLDYKLFKDNAPAST